MYLTFNDDIINIENNGLKISYHLSALGVDNRLAFFDNLGSGGNCMIDVAVMASGQVLSVSDETLFIYSDLESYYENWYEGIESKSTRIINWLEEAEHLAYTVLLNASCVRDIEKLQADSKLWDIVHANMDNPGVMPRPFSRSFDEYSGWSELDGRANFGIWLRSIAYSMGYRKYEMIGNIITVPKLFKLRVALELVDGKYWLETVDWYTGKDRLSFECGVAFWYDFLPYLAVDTNIDLEQLRYEMVETYALDKVTYEAERWMPWMFKQVIKLALKEGISLNQMTDLDYLNEKYNNWLENGLLD